MSKQTYNNVFRSIFISIVATLAGFFGYKYQEDIVDHAGSAADTVIEKVEQIPEFFERDKQKLQPEAKEDDEAPDKEEVPQEETKESIVNPTDHAKILNVKPYYLLAVRYDGKYELKTGGTNSWRYNNPGKLLHGKFTREHGALGSDGKYAIFPSYEIGRRANELLLFESDHGYKDLTVEGAITKYAPSSDGYKTSTYIKNVAAYVGVSASYKIAEFNNEQKQKFLDAIEREEVFIKGVTTLFADEAEFKAKGW